MDDLTKKQKFIYNEWEYQYKEKSSKDFEKLEPLQKELFLKSFPKKLDSIRIEVKKLTEKEVEIEYKEIKESYMERMSPPETSSDSFVLLNDSNNLSNIYLQPLYCGIGFLILVLFFYKSFKTN